MLIKANIKNVRIEKPYKGSRDFIDIMGEISSRHWNKKGIVLKAYLSKSEKAALLQDLVRESLEPNNFVSSLDIVPYTINIKGPFDNITLKIRLRHGSKNTFNDCN